MLAKLSLLQTLRNRKGIDGLLFAGWSGSLVLILGLFVALFFPLSPDIRDGLHESQLAPYLTTYDGQVEEALLSTIPWFARPFVLPYFRRHRL